MQRKRKLNANRGIYKFCGNRGNMHHWLRGMDAPETKAVVLF